MASQSVELWTVKDVVRVLKLKKSWVYAHADSGDLPHLRIGSCIRFDPKDVLAYIEKCRSRPARVLTVVRKKKPTPDEVSALKGANRGYISEAADEPKGEE